MSSGLDVAEQLRLLQQGYAKQLPAKLAQLEQALHKCQDAGKLQSLRFLTHGLAGSGATFGYPDVSAVARRLEAMVDGALSAERSFSEKESKTAADLLAALYRAAREPVARTPAPAQQVTVAPYIAKKLIYLVDDDTELAADLALQLGHFGYIVRTFGTPERLIEAAAEPTLAVVLMDIIFPQGDLAGAEAVIKLATTKRLAAPVIFLSVRGDLPARLAAARAGATAYITKPVDVGALVSTLDDLTSDLPPEPYRVLIVDDSMALAEYYACTLQAAGICTDVVIDPLCILAHLADFRPDLVLMDMYMPGCTGAELATVIRKLENYTMVPIVFLSAEGDVSKQLTAMKLGGDDFLTKPIAPEHLVSAVSTRLQRYRVLRSHIERDSLTGLLNHAATKGRLTLETARAAREKHTLCFAMLDLDLFKTVNDTYGHPVGDRVLKTLAELLRRRLRETDIIGRIGGEEFAIILPHTGSTNAMTLIEELREAFSRVRQYADGLREFNVTFSCGIAEYRIGDSADGIYAQADQALYQAKQTGRNQVMIAG